MSKGCLDLKFRWWIFFLWGRVGNSLCNAFLKVNHKTRIKKKIIKKRIVDYTCSFFPRGPLARFLPGIFISISHLLPPPRFKNLSCLREKSITREQWLDEKLCNSNICWEVLVIAKTLFLVGQKSVKLTQPHEQLNLNCLHKLRELTIHQILISNIT